ncbi:MAG: hypothetical protein ACI8ZM_000911 [Crocinitomix sp.]|jgi:hypothetical protein
MKFDLGHIRKIVVVHIALDGNRVEYHYMSLKQSKGEIDFVARGERISDLDALIKATSNRHPILLHFTGKGILNRKAVFQENYQHSILLNGNLDAFYFSDYIEKQNVFSSVIRKDVVDEYVRQFTEKKCQIISISSGPFHAAILNGVLKKETLTIGNTKLQFQENLLTSFSKITEEENESRSILLGGETIPNKLIVCAAVGAAFFNPIEQLVHPVNETIFSETKEEAKQKNIFIRFGMGMMLFFLLLLFANHLYLGHLNQEVVDNSVYLMAYDEQLTLIADLDDEKSRKEKLLQSSGLLNKNFLSFYLMEIANSVPAEITFDEIVLRPLKEDIKQRKKIAFEEHLVLVNGRSQTSHILSKWIEEVEQKDWLSKVDILSYDYEKNEGVFELEMIVY